MKSINIDLETFSYINLAKSGVYRYAESDDFEILLFGYSVDGADVKVIDLANGEKIPQEIINALSDKTVIKWAFNAQFERICLSKYLGIYLSPESWQCTMVWSAILGLPMSLEGVGAVLGLEKQKMSEGKSLIRYFCIPCKPTKINGNRARNLPKHNLEKWEIFKQYNKRDVKTELSIKERLSKFPVSKIEWLNYHIDQDINDRGIKADLALVNEAIECNKIYNQIATAKAYELTGLQNPNSVGQIKEWLTNKGIEVESLNKKVTHELIAKTDGEVLEVLKLRLAMSKTSVKKYESIKRCVCKDNRMHGLLQFYGANRTGRWAGRLVQVQNLPQNHIKDLSLARNLLKSGRNEDIEMFYESTPAVLSELIRTAFVPKQENKFFVADFSAIEARVIAWLAGEKWRMKVFADGGDIYCASASKMFHVPVEKNGVNGHLRQKGKISELALGYGGSVGALKAMGALNMGVVEEELQPLVTSWRNSNPNITHLWWDVDKATKTAVIQKIINETHGIKFSYQSGMLFITLPSGRNLVYVKPKIGQNKFGGDCVTYEGIGTQKKWTRLDSYGPKFVENIVQAIARDILAEAMLRLNSAGYSIVMHVHDEVVIEAPVDTSLENICTIMGQTPKWAKGINLRADGYVCDFYRKD